MLDIFHNIPISFIEYTMLKNSYRSTNVITNIKLKNRYNVKIVLSVMKNNRLPDLLTSNVKQKMKAIIWEI